MRSLTAGKQRNVMAEFSPAELAAWSGGTWRGNPGRITGVSTDTRTMTAGDLFVALTGSRFDGHAFLAESFAKGASGAVVKKDRKTNNGGGYSLLLVDDPAEALRSFAREYRRKLDSDIVAVTGSAGKTTVKEMAACVLSGKVAIAATRGNWNNDIGLPLSLLKMEPSVEVGVFELGMNHPGEIAALCRILQPDMGIITNVGPVHLEFFRTIDAIASEKATLLDSLPADGAALLDRESVFFDMFRRRSSARIVTVSGQGDADYVYKVVNEETYTFRITDAKAGESFELRSKAPGRHNVYNAVLAAAVGREYGIDWETIQSGLDNYRPPPMRWEEKTAGGVTIVNDAYNANPMSMRAAMDTFGKRGSAGRRWLVLGGMLELGNSEEAEHLGVGEYAGKADWDGIITVGRLGEIIARGASSGGFSKDRITVCKDNQEAVGALLSKLKPGDHVLFKASRGIKLEEVVDGVGKRLRGA